MLKMKVLGENVYYLRNRILEKREKTNWVNR